MNEKLKNIGFMVLGIFPLLGIIAIGYAVLVIPNQNISNSTIPSGYNTLQGLCFKICDALGSNSSEYIDGTLYNCKCNFNNCISYNSSIYICELNNFRVFNMNITGLNVNG